MEKISLRYSSVDRSKSIKERLETPFKLNGSLALENIPRFPAQKYIDTSSRNINKPKSNIKLKKLPAIVLNKELSNFDNIININSDNNSTETNYNEFSDVSSLNRFISNLDNKSYKKRRIIVSGMTNALTNNTESTDYNLNDFNAENFSNNIIRLKPIIKKTSSPHIRKINISKNISTVNNTEKNNKIVNIKNKYRNFHADRVIKEIKKNMSSQKIYENNLVYDKKLENVVFDASKLLNMHRQINASFFKNNDGIATFVDKNKQICVKNLMIKLLNKQNVKLYDKHTERGKNIENYKNIIENDEKNFDKYAYVQKISYFKISDALDKMQKKNLHLLEQQFKMKANTKIIEDESFKLIEQINSLRIYAKFINRVLFGDPSFFEYELIPEYKDDERPNLKYIINNIFDIYKKFLTGDIDIKNDEEYSFLNDPQIMIRKFKELENKIMRDLQKDEYFLEEVRKIKREKKEILSEMEERKKKIEKEYENSVKEYNDYKNNVFKGDDYNIGGISNQDYLDAAFELCSVVEENFGGTKSNNRSSDFRNFYVLDELKICKKIVEKKEAYIDSLWTKLENYEKESPKLFHHILNKRKLELKIMNQEAAKQNLEEIEAKKKIKSDERMKKIIFKVRRMATPPNLSKKIKNINALCKTDGKRADEDYLYY